MRSPTPRIHRAGLALALLMLATPAALRAQRLAPHAYLPLDHWSVPLLEHLIVRGVIRDPTPLERPWLVGQIGAALAEADTARATRAERRSVTLLRDLLAPTAPRALLAIDGDLGGRASTHARRPRFNLRPEGPGDVVPYATGRFSLQFGPGVLAMSPVVDPMLDADPDYGGFDQPIDARMTDTYVGYRSALFHVDLGNLSRNWGPPEFPGLLLSPWTESFEHLYVRFGPRAVSVGFLLAQLDGLPNLAGEPTNRYVYGHRLVVRPTSWLDLAAWEALIAAGPGRSIELWYLNPFRFVFETRDVHAQAANAMVGGDGEIRVGRRLRLTGSLTFDDIQIFKSPGPVAQEPPSFAITAAAATFAGPLAIRLGYTVVSNLMYRTPDPAESPLTAVNTARGRVGTGLGRNYSDYDQLTLRLGVMPAMGIHVEPELTLLRQGEGDFRLPFPAPTEYATTPTLFAGIVERTIRAALRAQVRLPLHLPVDITADGDAGVHWVHNAGNVDGASETEFVGSLMLRIGLGRGWALPVP